jgi:hypothetical protein
MHDMITTTYKGQDIEFNVVDETWQWQDYRNTSLQKVCAYMDRVLPKQWQPTEAYNLNYSNELERVTVVSAGADGSLWIQGSHRKEKAHRALYVISSENDARLERIRTLEAERDVLNNQINAIYRDELERFTMAHLKVGAE